jgi:RNA polymerase sigma-70 factor (ECF subfamily)
MEVSASQLAIQDRTHSLQWPWVRSRKADSKNDPDSSDVDLAKRLERKDEHAFLTLYDLHRSTVFRFLMHMTGSIATAEDLTQEVFVVILDAMSAGTVQQFDPKKGTWEGYLLGVARNLARADQRKVRRLLSLDSIVEAPGWERLVNTIFQENRTCDAVALVESRSELRLLYSAILELPQHYREVVVLCGIQEKGYRDAALILRCSEGTIASRMSRAKSLLATKLHRSRPGLRSESTMVCGKEGAHVGSEIEANDK